MGGRNLKRRPSLSVTVPQGKGFSLATEAGDPFTARLPEAYHHTLMWFSP
jgi:hypothetical protein